MYKIFLFTVFFAFSQSLFAQDSKVIMNGEQLHPHGYSPSKIRGGEIQSGELVFDPILKPFYHGVASGDPKSDAVIIWTRVTPDSDMDIVGTWKMATDINLQNIASSGEFTTNAQKDYTIKLDVTGLNPATTYYYQFEAMGKKSIIGRTRTTPAIGGEHLRIGVISCVNYQWGYFNALERLAERKDLDAVVHMGDYLYEYSADYYAHPNLTSRGHIPNKEMVTLADYRVRFSQYRLDPMMRKFHQQHPIIATWDDHESTNDSWSGGAQNHQPETEGDWNDRVENSITAYDEWMPFRHPRPEQMRAIYRTISYGDLLDIIMLETRLHARQEPLAPKGLDNPEIDTLAWYDADRTMLGLDQFSWLANTLVNSQAKWKLIGSSIMMVPIPPDLITNLDAWDGYPIEREKIFGLIEANNIKNVGVISGDFHMSFASNLLSVVGTGIVDYVTKGRSAGFEFTTPSVTSANLNELTALSVPGLGVINPLAMNLPERSPIATALEAQAVNGVPWLHYMNSDQHGYMILDITPSKIQSDWYYSKVLSMDNIETYGAGYFVEDANPSVKKAEVKANDKAVAPDLAPFELETSVKEADSDLIFIGCYPNPITDFTIVNFALDEAADVNISLNDINGNEVAIIHNGALQSGVHGIPFSFDGIATGTYIVIISHKQGTFTRKVSVAK